MNTVGATPGSQGGPFAVDNINAVTATSGVPEPASVSMFAAAIAVLLVLARRARRRQTS
ncbi:MAG: PEP-CTERM sorting domain-containing protein [Acidobacteriaceae bacterium]|nr:PEP-CTERM sorting domain-containing protein [Acidobacteriaceae bacterium]